MGERGQVSGPQLTQVCFETIFDSDTFKGNLLGTIHCLVIFSLVSSDVSPVCVRACMCVCIDVWTNTKLSLKNIRRDKNIMLFL